MCFFDEFILAQWDTCVNMFLLYTACIIQKLPLSYKNKDLTGSFTMRYVKIIAGNILITAAYAFLTVPNQIVNGGVTSFSMIAASRFHCDTAVITNMMTLLLLALCYFFLGRDYFKGTIVGGICYMVFFTAFHALNICLTSNRLIAALAAALMVGMGYFLCISEKATAISFDTIALILNKKNPAVNVAATIFVINIVVILLGIFRYGLWAVVLGAAFSAIQSLTLNSLLKVKAYHTE